MRTGGTESVAAAALPRNTVGTFGDQHAERRADHDGRRASRSARRASTVAICVLSPISARKNATVGDAEHARDATSAARRRRRACRASAPTRRRRRTTARPASAARRPGPTPRTQLPTRPASAWLTSVATRMPATIGQGLRSGRRGPAPGVGSCRRFRRAATTAVETRRASSMGEESDSDPGGRGSMHVIRSAACGMPPAGKGG